MEEEPWSAKEVKSKRAVILALREKIQIKKINNPTPEQNGRLIILGDGEIKGRASLPRLFFMFLAGSS